MFCIGTLRETTKKLIKEAHHFTGHGPNQSESSKQIPADALHCQPLNNEFYGKTKIKLKKLPGDEDFGIVTTMGGSDRQSNLLKVAYIKPGTPAFRHDGIEVGDFISFLEGKSASSLTPQDLSTTLHNRTTQQISLDIDYILPDTSHTSFSVVKKRIEIKIARDEYGSLGFTLRGGTSINANYWRPLTVTQIRPGGSIDVEGTIKIGDRVLSINHVSMHQKSLDHALQYLKSPNNEDAIFLVEYDVSVLEVVQNAAGPLLVEIDKLPGCSLGVTLDEGFFKGHRVMYITEVEQASIADRCGALHHGDHILAVDGYGLEDATVDEANEMLRVNPGHQIQLEIVPAKLVLKHTTYGKDQQSPKQQHFSQQRLMQQSQQNIPEQTQQTPVHQRQRSLTLPQVSASLTTQQQRQLLTLQRQHRLIPLPGPRKDASLESDESPTNESSDHSKSTNYDDGRFSSASLTSLLSHNTYNSMTTQVGSAMLPPCHPALNRDKHRNPNIMSTSLGGQVGTNSLGGVLRTTPHTQICHVDVVEVVLVAEKRSFGLQIDPSNGRISINFGALTESPVISYIEPRGPAERCGVLQEGDRVLAINGQNLEGQTIEEVDEMIRESGVKIILLVEFDVAESIIPSSGVFIVKLAKRSAGLGVTISCPKNRKPGQHLVISDVKKGSVAHRTGSIQPGDKLLAIDNVRLDDLQCSLEDSARILQDTHDIVKLTIQKDESFADEPDPTHLITYTVELPKFAGPVGITVSGSEEPFDPIFISSLLPGGMAERTGALHVGDRLLAINRTSLRGKTLTDAVHLLQNAGPTVTLKITRPANKRSQETKLEKGLGSMDSALESWGSSAGTEGFTTLGTKVFYHPSLRHRSRSQHYFDSVNEQNDNVNNDINSPLSTKTTPPQSLRHQGSAENPTSSIAVTTSSSDAGIDTSAGGSVTSNAPLLSSSAAENVMRWQDHEYNKDTACSATNNGANNNGIVIEDSFGGKNNEADEWSKRLDELDQLRLNMSPAMDSFSDLPDIVEVIADVEDNQQHENKFQEVGMTGEEQPTATQSDPETVNLQSITECPVIDVGLPTIPEAEIQLKEVEEQLQNIFTPTPIELLKVVLTRVKEKDDFGFSLSDGVFEKGVYVSAIRPGGPASSKLRPFDRILQVNSTKTREMDCSQLVPLISSSGASVELVITRNPLVNLPKPQHYLKRVEQLEKGGSLKSFKERGGRQKSIEFRSNPNSPNTGASEALKINESVQRPQSSCDCMSLNPPNAGTTPGIVKFSVSPVPQRFSPHIHISFAKATRETYIGNDNSNPSEDESESEVRSSSSKTGTLRRKSTTFSVPSKIYNTDLVIDESGKS